MEVSSDELTFLFRLTAPQNNSASALDLQNQGVALEICPKPKLFCCIAEPATDQVAIAPRIELHLVTIYLHDAIVGRCSETLDNPRILSSTYSATARSVGSERRIAPIRRTAALL
jgi:hypothetical protein